MASTRLQHSSHHSHLTSGANGHHHTSSSQPKSHAVAGVQDAYWSDEDDKEQADADDECPLCVSKMDIDDLSFKPCPCGYQICRFCFHNIKENLNGRCPACRREYTDELVEFNPISTDELKRLNAQKKRREKERKDIEALKRGHLTNVRIVQRNLLFVTGLGPRYMTEECIPQLRSAEFFGQYGKINKIVLGKRRGSVNGVYITYNRREDATRAIAGVDGSPSPGGGEVMRASYGTTKYCMSFLRNVTCTNTECLELHEWGDDRDCFTKQDLSSLKHALKDSEHRQKYVVGKEADSLPRTASWGIKGGQTVTPSPKPASTGPALLPSQVTLQTKQTRSSRTRLTTASQSLPRLPASFGEAAKAAKASAQDKKNGQPASSATVSSLPMSTTTSTSSEPSAPPGLMSPRTLASAAASSRPSTASDIRHNGNISVASSPSMASVTSSAPRRDSTSSPVSGIVPQSVTKQQKPKQGSPPPSSLPEVPSSNAYQVSAQAQELINDVRSRREQTSQVVIQSPFPDLDRMLSVFQGGEDTFTFSLDPRFASADLQPSVPLAPIPTPSTYRSSFDPFSSSHSSFSVLGQSPAMPPPGIGVRQGYSHVAPLHGGFPYRDHPAAAVGGSSLSDYSGSFNPFSDSSSDLHKPGSSSQNHLPEDEILRRGSRFGFARKKGSTASSNFSPSANPSPLQSTDALPQTPLYAASDIASPVPSTSSHQLPQWTYQTPNDLPPHTIGTNLNRTQESHGGMYSSGDHLTAYQQMSEAALKEMFNIGRNQTERRSEVSRPSYTSHFSDPAIMSMRMSAQHNGDHSHPSSIPPPGLSQGGSASFVAPPGLTLVNSGGPPGLSRSIYEMRTPNGHLPLQDNAISSPSVLAVSCTSSPSIHHVIPATLPSISSNASVVSSPILSPTDFPALPAPITDVQPRRDQPFIKAQEPKSTPHHKVNPATIGSPLALAATPSKALKKGGTGIPTKEHSTSPKIPSQEPLTRVTSKTTSSTAEQKMQSDTSAGKPTPTVGVSKPNPKQAAPQNKAAPLRAPTPEVQAPVLSRKAKKAKSSKPPKPIKVVDSSAVPSPVAGSPRSPQLPEPILSPEDSKAELPQWEPRSLSELLETIHTLVDIEVMAFFDNQTINPKSQLPLRYAPLVHALSALSINGHSFSSTPTSGSIDSAVSSFQQLLETLTQTISDLLRLLPRATWDESSTFDGVLRDMLKAEDFLDESFERSPSGTEDEVAALTLALEKRARWMEMQLAKLEDLHRDINSAAVRTVLSLNDKGWDTLGRLPKVGNSLQRFETVGKVECEEGALRMMSIVELEEALAIAKEDAYRAEVELKQMLMVNLDNF